MSTKATDVLNGLLDYCRPDEKDGKDEKVMTYLLHKAQTKTKLVWRSDR